MRLGGLLIAGALLAPGAAAQASDPAAGPAGTSADRLIGTFARFDQTLSGEAAGRHLFGLLNERLRCPMSKPAPYPRACALVVYVPVSEPEPGIASYYFMSVLEVRSALRAYVGFNDRYQTMTFEELAGNISVKQAGGGYASYMPYAVIGGEEDLRRAEACGKSGTCNAFSPCTHEELFNYARLRPACPRARAAAPG